MSKIFFIFVIVALVFYAEAENAEAGPYPGLDQTLGRFGYKLPLMNQMPDLLNPEYWKQQGQDGEMMIVKSYAPANGKSTSEVTLFTKEGGHLTKKTYTKP